MGEGTALAQGTLPELRRLISPGLWLEIKLYSPFPQLKNIVTEKQISEVLQVDMLSDDVIRLQVGSESAIPDVVSWLVQSGARILKVQPQEISLEEIYLQLQNSNHHSSKHAGG
jgi:hypothetical protein